MYTYIYNHITQNVFVIGWRPSNRFYQITPALHELYHVLCGLLVPITIGLSLPVVRL